MGQKQPPTVCDGCDKVFIGGSSAGGYLSMMLYFDGQYLGKYGLTCKDFAGFVFDAGQPTVHFNVLRERGLDRRRIVVDEAAPLYHITDYSGEPPMVIYVSENDIPNRYAQTELLRSTLKDFGYPEERITYHLMPGCKHCSYTASLEFSESVVDFINKCL